MRHPLPVPTSCIDPPCGVCCHGQEALPVGYWLSPLGDADPRRLPPELHAELEGKRDLYDLVGWPRDVPCIWYNALAKRCRHHEWRPEICIDFKLGGADCLRVRAAALGERP